MSNPYRTYIVPGVGESLGSGVVKALATGGGGLGVGGTGAGAGEGTGVRVKGGYAAAIPDGRSGA